MNDKPKASPSLGLEVTSTELKGACLAYRNRKPVLNSLLSIKVDREASTNLNVKPLYMGKDERLLRSLINKSLVVSALETQSVLVRQTRVQLTRERDIEAVIAFQTEPLLPFPIDEGLVDWMPLEKGPDSTRITIIATKKEQLAQHLETWHSIHIEPEVVGSAPSALAAFFTLCREEEPPAVLVNIGRSETTCILASPGSLLAAQSLRSGVDQWIECLENDTDSSWEKGAELLQQIDFSELSEQQYPSLARHLGDFRLKVARAILAMRKQAQGTSSDDIMITGEGAAVNGMAHALFESIPHRVVHPEPPAGFLQAGSDLQRFAIPIGIALTTLPKGKGQVNFRQDEYAYPYPWKRIKKPIGIYLAFCLLLSAALYFFGEAYIKSEEDSIRRSYVQLLALVKKPYSEFEKEFRGEAGARTQDKETPAISLNQQQLRERLAYLEKEIRATPDMFPLYPNIPRVSDFLAWLSSHPHIQGEGRNGKTQTPRIQMESFSYRIVKRPEQNKKREKYQARVELEFTTPTPRYAREFHDILLAPNEMVDPTGDVKWSAERGRYRATFFLKDKTRYPTSRRF